MYPDQVRRTVVVVGLLAVAALLVACGANDSPAASSATTAAATSATAPPVSGATETSAPADPSFPAGTQHLHFEFGPVDVQPGQNSIEYSKGKIPKPDVDGWIVRMSAEPQAGGRHGAAGRRHPPAPRGVAQRVATRHDDPDVPRALLRRRRGEDDDSSSRPATATSTARPTRGSSTTCSTTSRRRPSKIWVTYDLDFLPASAPAAASIVGAHPIWLDVQNGSVYPVFDVLKGTRHRTARSRIPIRRPTRTAEARRRTCGRSTPTAC